MTAEKFVRSLLHLLPHRKDEALEEILGWERAMATWPNPTYSQADRDLVARAKAYIQAGRLPEV